jgi:peptidoglycan/LPS O-acetylase OafA/YrhL
MTPRRRFKTLDGLRGVAAIGVMLFHYFYQSLGAFPCAAIAVDFFFILSGFVISHTYGKDLRSGLPAREYLTRRVIRIYPVMAVTLLVGSLALYATRAETLVSGREVVMSLLCNLSFLPYLDARFPYAVSPADPPLWSIFWEMYASVAFLFLVRLDRKKLALLVAGALLLLIAVSIGFKGYAPFDLNVGPLRDDFFGGFPRVIYGFGLGVLLRTFFDEKRRVLGRSSLALWAYFVFICVLVGPWKASGAYHLVVLVFLAPLLVMMGAFSSGQGIIDRVSSFLGRMSYPVYCLHVPLRRLTELLEAKLGFLSGTHISTQIFAVEVTLAISALIVMLYDEPVRARLIQFFVPSPWVKAIA